MRLHNSVNHHDLRREAESSTKSNRNQHWHEIADCKETAAALGDLGKLFRLKRYPLGKVQPSLSTLPDGSGHLRSGCEQKLQRWVEHLSQLLNCPLIESI